MGDFDIDVFDIRNEKWFPEICEDCIHKDVCYYLTEYGEATHCNYFMNKENFKEA